MSHHPALPAGIVTPLVTFLTSDGKPDRDATAALVEHQISGGVHGVLVTGSTGELGNLTGDQRSAVLRTVADLVRGRVPVWAGVAGLGTGDAVIAAREAEDSGADALLVLPPLFFDASDAELATHFRAIRHAVGVPVLAYDVPARTPRKMPVSVLEHLAAGGVIDGVKDSSGDLVSGRLLCSATADVPAFSAYAGAEVTIDAAVYLGFAGAVPGLANILPAPAREAYDAARRGDTGAAAAAQRTYQRLFAVLDVPLPGAGFSARAIDAIKVATALVLGLPMPGATAPFTAPERAFAAAVAEIVEPLAAAAGALPPAEPHR